MENAADKATDAEQADGTKSSNTDEATNPTDQVIENDPENQDEPVAEKVESTDAEEKMEVDAPSGETSACPDQTEPSDAAIDEPERKEADPSDAAGEVEQMEETPAEPADVEKNEEANEDASASKDTEVNEPAKSDESTGNKETGDAAESIENATEEAPETSEKTTDIIQEAYKRIVPTSATWKPKSGSFSLGVPGLTFSAQNLKIANDGTKMVQIHQSQITPSQLEALQSNPNIKVVFRHIPTGKSFTKPPKNLFSASAKSNGVKRKISDSGQDDSIYNFDEFDEDYSPYAGQPRSKVPNMGNGNSKFARYNPNVGMRKGPGRPRIIPDAKMMARSLHSRPILPAQIQLTDALVKLNKRGATNTVKVHVKQVSHDILINMELDPKYNIVLTAKHEVPPEHSLEELAKEWEEKETMEEPAEEKTTEDKEEEPEEVEAKQDVVEEEQEKVEEEAMDEENEERKKEEEERLKREKEERDIQAAEQQKLKEERREKEEAELLSSALLEKTSRSGRIRKPSRYSLDIARMTKRRSLYGDRDTSPDDEPVATPPPPPKRTPPRVTQSATKSGDGKKRGRGRPRKYKKEDVEDSSVGSTSINESSHDDEGKKSDLQSERKKSDLQNEEKKSDLQNEEKKSDLQNEGEKSDLQNEEEKSDLQNEEEKSDLQKSPPPPSSSLIAEPRVMMSPIDKRLAENIRLQESGSDQKTTQQTDKEKSEAKEVVKQDKKTELKDEAESDDKVEDKTTDAKPEEENTEENKADKEEESKSKEKAEEKESEEKVEESKSEEKTEDEKEKKEQKSEDDSKENEKVEDDELKSKPQEENAESKPQETSNESENAEKNKDIESPSEVLARKLSKEGENAAESSETKTGSEETALKDFVEEEGDVDNKYRLRKLLQQCSIEEIRSVAMPRALDVISLGDFFLHKAGQMASEKVSYTALYNQLQNLHASVEKESIRYSTLLRRANKVGGDRRMEKVILMPVYNKQAAESLHISSSSIDAHIGGIHQKPTTHMIAANSFHMQCKMEAPLHRLKLPELTDKTHGRKKRGQPYPHPPRFTTKLHENQDMTTQSAQRSYNAIKQRGTWKRGYQVRKPNYLSGSQTTSSSHTSLQEHARQQLANRYQSQLAASNKVVSIQSAGMDNVNTNPIIVTPQALGSATEGGIMTTATTPMEGVVGSNATVSPVLTTQESELQTGTEMVTEEGATVVQAEDGKQLVSIGDGQYVELPEGYTLIQTDDGYIIGQPGATVVQGEDGNFYMTSTEEGTTEMNEQVLTTTAAIGDTPSTDQILEQLTQT